MAIIIFCCAELTGQVKIKERVEIKPIQKTILNLDTKSTSPRNIHVEFSAVTGEPTRLGVYGFSCGGEQKWVWGSGGTISLDFIFTGAVNIGYQIHGSEMAPEVPYHLRISDDTRLLNDIYGIINTMPCVSGGFTCDYVSLFGIYADLNYNFHRSEICVGSQGLISFEPDYQMCSTTYIPETEPVTVSIIRGQQFGRLTFEGEIIAGGSVTFPVDREKLVWFVPVDPMPEGVIVDSVEIQIEAGVMKDTKTIAVRACSRGTSFDFFAAKPKIYIRTEDALSVQPAMDNSSTVVWDKNTDPVTFTITSGSEYGGFAINGQKQEGTSITLQGAQLDQLSFIANDSLPNGLTEGPVSIQASSKGIVKNASLIVQSTAKLKLTLDVSPASIDYGGYTTATAQTVNIDTQEPEAPPADVTYNFILTQGSAFARFYQYDGGGGGASIASLSKTSSADGNNSLEANKFKRSRISAKSVSKGLNKTNQDAAKYKIQSLSKTTSGDNGGPDALVRVPQSEGNAVEWPEATDQEPVNPEGEIVQVVVSASDANIAPATGSFLVKSSCIVVSVNPSTIKQGETATITVLKKNASGGLEDLSADDYVEFEITTGANAGQLGSPDGSQTGGYIGGAFQSAVFTATVDPSLPNDNPVRISVYTEYCSGLGTLTVTKDECIQIKHKSLSVGDTTSLSIVYAESGSPVPADKSLNISISGGPSGENGFLLIGGSIGTSFTGVTQPILYIAPLSIQGDSLVVPIAASLSESGGGGGVIAASYRQKDSVKMLLKKNSTIRTSIQTVCKVENVTVTGCTQKIDKCGNNDPQKFNDVCQGVEVISSTTPWKWTDANNVSQTETSNNGCSYGPPTPAGKEENGKAYLMNSVGSYKLFDDLKVSVCLDNSDPEKPKWQFNLDNLRIPVFSDVCPPGIVNGINNINLGDENSAESLWKTNIKDCVDWQIAAYDINYFIIGPYHHKPEDRKVASNGKSFYFSGGTLAHENAHVEQIKSKLKEKSELMMKDIRSIFLYKDKDTQCPDKAIEKETAKIKSTLNSYLVDIRNEMTSVKDNTYKEELKSEIDADNTATEKYKKIKNALKYKQMKERNCIVDWENERP